MMEEAMRTLKKILCAFLCALMFLSGVAFAAIPEDYNVKTP